MASKIKDLERKVEILTRKESNLEANIIEFEKQQDLIKSNIYRLRRLEETINESILLGREEVKKQELVLSDIKTEVTHEKELLETLSDNQKILTNEISQMNNSLTGKKELLREILSRIDSREKESEVLNKNKLKIESDICVLGDNISKLSIDEKNIESIIHDKKDILKKLKNKYTELHKKTQEKESLLKEINMREKSITLREQRYSKIRFKK